MNEIITTLRDFIKSEDIVTIDNTIFRFHYKGGVAFLLFSFILTSKQHFGEPIYCLGDERANIDAINSYCWIHSTFTIYKRFTGKNYYYYLIYRIYIGSQAGFRHSK